MAIPVPPVNAPTDLALVKYRLEPSLIFDVDIPDIFTAVTAPLAIFVVVTL